MSMEYYLIELIFHTTTHSHKNTKKYDRISKGNTIL